MARENGQQQFPHENAALRRKLQSKSEALLILSKDLDKCRTERDQFKLMAEQLQIRYSHLKRKTNELGIHRIFLQSEDESPIFKKGMSASEAFNEAMEQNKVLRIQVEDLKQRLQDAYGDMKVLRAGNMQYRMNVVATAADCAMPDHQKEEFLQQLETLHTKYKQLEADFQAVLDEKEEVVNQRDVFKCKAHRLNFELGALMKSTNKDCIDVDALIMENRYMHDRLQQLQSEQQVTKQSLVKYKVNIQVERTDKSDQAYQIFLRLILKTSVATFLFAFDVAYSQGMLDKKRSKDSVRLGVTSAAGMIVTHKQVQQLLEKTAPGQMPNTPATLDQLKNLCLALLEALGDKSLNLAHQKKTNKILASRIVELESLAAACGAPVSPSQILLEGYSSAEVDQDMSRILNEQIDVECDLSGVPTEFEASHGNPSKKNSPAGGVLERGAGDANGDISPITPVKTGASRLVTYPSFGSDGDGDHGQHDPLPPQVQLLLEKALEELIHSTPSEDGKSKS